jgi:putative hemolysin
MTLSVDDGLVGMQASGAALARPRLLDRFWPMPGVFDFTGLLPALRPTRRSNIQVPRLASAQGALGRIGPLEVRLARSDAEIRQAQRLRFRVFYAQGRARAGAAVLLARRDIDAFDAVCDHLLVIDHAASGHQPRVVGTYRLLRQDVAERNCGFYTSREFAIDSLLARHRPLRFLELGRSCVLPQYRNKRTVELLWQGVWSYVRQHRFDVMFGCASLEGIDADRHALALSFLHHHAGAPEAWRARALPERFIDMNRMAKAEIDPRAALRELPPLIKGYLRLGCHVGEGAVIDPQFGTTDVLIVLPVSAIDPRYFRHFGAYGENRAA